MNVEYFSDDCIFPGPGLLMSEERIIRAMVTRVIMRRQCDNGSGHPGAGTLDWSRSDKLGAHMGCQDTTRVVKTYEDFRFSETKK